MIKRKEFNTGNFKKRRIMNRLEHPVSKLLKKNKAYAMTAKEISKRTKMNEDTVRSMLYSTVNVCIMSNVCLPLFI